jgi:hypothetical protein
LARKCGISGGCPWKCWVQNVILWFWCSPRVPLQTRLFFFGHSIFCVRFEVLISVLKMVVFQAVSPVLPKLWMSLLGLLLKGLAVQDQIFLTILTTSPPEGTERCWCRFMTRPCRVLAPPPGRKWHRIGELHLKEFETSCTLSYRLKSRYGIQSFMIIFIYLCCTVQQVDTTVLIDR